MKIIVEGSGHLADLIKDLPPLENVHTVAEVVQLLSPTPRTGIIIVVNDRLASLDTVLAPGDVLHLIPAIAGGG